MNLTWIVLLAVAAVVAFAVRWATPHGSPDRELGFVSHQWLAEYRNSHMSDQQR